ncbi:MAG: hypothetical protein EXS00_01240 [Phycisphaerales bacterium]|nr:hypothetical protein [Phycisphaerales bacterium]
MKKSHPNPTKLNGIVRAHAGSKQDDPNAQDPVALLVHSFLIADASTSAAEAAMQRIRTGTVDFNDLRVSLVNEIVAMIGADYPFAQERSSALRRVLYDIYRRQHKMSLDHLMGKPKREIRDYVTRLDGMSSYVAARVLLLCYEIHSVPVDLAIYTLLVERGVLPKETSLQEAGDKVSHIVKAENARSTHFALVAAADERHAAAARKGAKSGAAAKATKVGTATGSGKTVKAAGGKTAKAKS